VLVGAAAGLLVVAGLVGHLLGHGKASAPVSPRPRERRSAALPLGELSLGVAFGATPEQVVRRLGAPTTRDGSCWVYRGRAGAVRGRVSGPYVDALKFCFSPGPLGRNVVTQIYSHTVAHTIVETDPMSHTVFKRRFPARWGYTVAIAKVPSWYVQESS